VVTDLEEDDFFRARIIYCVDLTEPSDDRLNVAVSQPRVVSQHEKLNLASDNLEKPQKISTSENNVDALDTTPNAQNTIASKFNLEDELKLINCHFYLDQLVNAGFNQEVHICFYLRLTLLISK
jgi:hypothetical protein